jgi:peptidyl-prolyl cis-trans isomerase SurA
MIFFTNVMAQQDQEKVDSQEKKEVIDKVVAIVGKNIILLSDIENQYLNYKLQGELSGSPEEMKCSIFEDLLFQNLLVAEADVDSIVVENSQVNSELDRRISMFINQFGSQEKLERYYNKTLPEIKSELFKIIKNQLLAQQEQQKIIGDVSVTPSEIKTFYKNIPEDSLPLIKTEYVIQQIVKEPPISIEEKLRVKEQLLDLRKRILKGENFSTLAILYSEDPGSAKKGGELGFYGRGQLYPEFEAAAFKLKEGEISDVVETEAGYHIIQLIERKGDYINVRHILLVPKVSPLDLLKARNELDSIASLIRHDSITFDKAVIKFSDDPNKNNGGYLLNPYTGGTSFEAEQLDPQVAFVIEKLKPGEISNPVPMKTEKQQDAYRILYLKHKTPPHRANLKDDYPKIQEWALQNKQKEAIDKWVDEKSKTTYIKIDDSFKKCKFKFDWLNN